MRAPAVCGFGDYDSEPFEEYIARWPPELANFPNDVIENWVHRHWQDFSGDWGDWPLEEFAFRLCPVSNDEIMEIDHVGDWLQTLDYWGDELFRDVGRRDTWLAKFMLEAGTAPAPLIVSRNSGGREHPRGGAMKATQLIEGHMRLAYLRGMIRHSHPALRGEHEVWLLDLPRSHPY